MTRRRVVFDTNTVVSALLFSAGRLSWLRVHWREGACLPLLSSVTAEELLRVLAYPKFRLAPEDRIELLSEYLPFCETVEISQSCPVQCRDSADQPLLDLAYSGHAEIVVSGDADLLALAGEAQFTIESPEAYRQRLLSDD